MKCERGSPAYSPGSMLSHSASPKYAHEVWKYSHDPSLVLASGSKLLALKSVQPKMVYSHDPSSALALGFQLFAFTSVHPNTVGL